MKLENKKIINRSLDDVYELVRDNLEKLVPYMPNVDKIKTVSTKAHEDGVDIVNHWYAKAEVPGLLKKFLNPDLLSWKDYAHWKNQEHLVEYKLESTLGNDLFDANGINYFRDAGENKTELVVTCNVVIYADKVPGIPKIIAKKALPLIEGLIEKILGPNLTALGDGLNEYFKENS